MVEVLGIWRHTPLNRHESFMSGFRPGGGNRAFCLCHPLKNRFGRCNSTCYKGSYCFCSPVHWFPFRLRIGTHRPCTSPGKVDCCSRLVTCATRAASCTHSTTCGSP